MQDKPISIKQDKSDKTLVSDKTLDRALILPIVGLIFLVPPVASIFQIDLLVAGIPLAALYLFSVWGLLILGAAMLSRKLRGFSQVRQETTQSKIEHE